MKEIKDSLNKLGDKPYSWIISLNKESNSQKKNWSLYSIQLQSIPVGFFFVNTDKLIIKFILKDKGTRRARNTFWQKRINLKESHYLFKDLL